MNRTFRKWTEEEDRILLQQVKASPQNLSRCFIAVSQAIGRSPEAVSAHWYTSLSKRADVCFFTASARHLSKNRKNGKGVPVSRSLWQRLLYIIRNL